MKKHSLYNRILSGILSIVTLISLIPLQVFSAGAELPAVEESVQVSVPEARFQIKVDGEEKESLTLRSFEKIEISAEGLMGNAQYQWQILHPEKPDVWVSIYGATDTTLHVTLALVKNMLDGSNTTQLRCRATVEGVPQYTPAITVAYDETAVYTPVVEAEPVPETTPEEVTEPTEATEATEPTESTETIEPTEVPETIAPTETIEVTEPTEVIETTEPIEVTEPAAVTEPTETAVATEPTEVTETTEPAETQPTTEPVEPVEMTEPAEETTPVEVTEPAAVSETTGETEPALIEETIPAETVETTMATGETTPAEAETEEASQPAGKPEYSAAPETAILSGMTLFGAPARAAEDDEFVTVTIEYIRYDYKRDENGALVKDANNNPILDDEGSVAFNSYVATLQKGTGLNTTVPVPTMVGYDAHLNDGDTVIKQVEISLDDIQKNMLYTVKYKPAQVNYTVRYYFQNVYDDLYVENSDIKETVVGKGATGTTPPDDVMKAEVPGFLSLYYQPDSIAADGSTVFEVYYERNYYLMEFDCNGGYGTDTLYVRYGTYISVPQPVLAGYVFDFWDLTSTEESGQKVETGNGTKEAYDTLPETMPPYNVAYKAIWKTAETTYTVAYWIKNDDGPNTYIGSRMANAESNTSVSGSDDLSTVLFCGYTNHTHTKACFSCESGHVHNESCVPTSWNTKLNGLNDGELTALRALGEDEPEAGFIYGLYYNNSLYYRVNFGTVWYGWRNGGSTEVLQGEELGSATVTHNGVIYTATKYQIREALKCGHNHEGERKTCSLQAHRHTDSCNPNAKYVKYVGCDDPVTVEGDGSTVMNVYYEYKTYTIRYVYARENNSKYQIATLTQNGVLENCEWKDVSGELPTFIDPSGDTERSSFTKGNYTYYYISLTAKFGEDISEKWPSANIGDMDGYNWGSWAAAYGTGYRETYGNAHANIVGPYPVMSADMIVDNPELLPDGTYLAQNMIAWWGKDQGISAHAYHNYFEVLSPPSDEEITEKPVTIDGNTYVKYNNKVYQLSNDVFTAAHNKDTRVDPVEFEGFIVINEDKKKQESSLNYDNGGNCTLCAEQHSYCNIFYYDRLNYKLNFKNHGKDLMGGGGATVPYGKNLEVYGDYVNEAFMANHYPDTLEPGAYEFTGWYSTETFVENTKIDWSTMTMPASDMVVYARWEPVKHDVTFYTLFDDIGKTEGDEDYVKPFLTAEDVPHGDILGSTYNKIPSVTDDPRIEGYTFIGWFYMDEDNKKRFAPDSMEITRDLVLFAEWTTEIDTTYEIWYVLKNAAAATETTDQTAHPAGAPVADSIFAHSSVGKTKTFTAKGMTELYPAFQVGFFPTVNSHSILMDKDPENNIHTFEYVHDGQVWYKVRYLDASTNMPIPGLTEKVAHTNQAVITEKFKPAPGYIPQNYYIRKTLAYDGEATEPIEENVITFYYVKDEAHGMYSVEYYLENADSQDEMDTKYYTQYESIVGTADLKNENGDPNTISATVKSYEGYTYQENMSQVITYEADGKANDPVQGTSGKVSANGLTIKLYYKRNSYPYIIEYREYGVEDGAAPLKTITTEDSKAKFGTQVSYSLIEENPERDDRIIQVDGNTYEYFDSDATDEELTKSTTIRAFEDGEENPNKLIFYFIRKEMKILYHAICTEPAADFGFVSPNTETASNTNTIAGSTAAAKPGFRFLGWYKDEEGKSKVEDSWVKDGNHLKPEELIQNDKWENHYYALFEPVRKDLKIVKNGENLAKDDSFIFTITGKNVLDQDVSMMVSIQGKGEVTIRDLYCGEYTVTETNWSWEYRCTGVSLNTGEQAAKNACSVSLTNDSAETTTVTFANTPKDVDWLHGESCNENVFNPKT